MRAHLTLLLTVCVTAPRTDCGWDPLDGHPVVGRIVGPSAPSGEAGTPVTEFCSGYKAGTLQGWKDGRRDDSTPEGHVPLTLLNACVTPYCGVESYQDGYERGKNVGLGWARRYP